MSRRLARKIYGRWMERRTIRGVATALGRDPKACVETDVLIAGLADNTRSDTTHDVAALGNLELQPRQPLLFPNGFKADAPDKQRPDYWGAFNPGNGQAIVRISAWSRKNRFEHDLLSGATSYPMPDRSEAEQQAAQTELLQLVESGALSKGMLEKKGKTRGRE